MDLRSLYAQRQDFLQKIDMDMERKLGVVAHSWNPTTQETEVGGTWYKTLSRGKKKKKT
jgi:hypothetical protein